MSENCKLHSKEKKSSWKEREREREKADLGFFRRAAGALAVVPPPDTEPLFFFVSISFFFAFLPTTALFDLWFRLHR